jgi:hypothetical protein
MDTTVHSLIAISMLAFLCTASAVLSGQMLFSFVFAAEFLVALAEVIRLFASTLRAEVCSHVAILDAIPARSLGSDLAGTEAVPR